MAGAQRFGVSNHVPRPRYSSSLRSCAWCGEMEEVRSATPEPKNNIVRSAVHQARQLLLYLALAPASSVRQQLLGMSDAFMMRPSLPIAQNSRSFQCAQDSQIVSDVIGPMRTGPMGVVLKFGCTALLCPPCGFSGGHHRVVGK